MQTESADAREADQALLRERARKLAAKQRRHVHLRIRHHVVVFEREGETYGVPIGRVQEVRHVSVSRLPGLPAAIQGIFQIRGSIYSLADPAALFDGGRTPPPHGGATLAVVVHSSLGSLGLRADVLLGPRQLTDSEFGGRPDEDCFLDVTTDLLAVVDVDQLARRAELRVGNAL